MVNDEGKTFDGKTLLVKVIQIGFWGSVDTRLEGKGTPSTYYHYTMGTSTKGGNVSACSDGTGCGFRVFFGSIPTENFINQGPPGLGSHCLSMIEEKVQKLWSLSFGSWLGLHTPCRLYKKYL